ncbi:MAG: carboxypeptidase-like regulatory domain-containing protein [Flavobacteriaceae bacterium]
MKKYIIAIIPFILPFYSYSQQIYKGRVLDSLSKKPLYLINVSYIKKDIGTYTDAEGFFEIKKDTTDYLFISSVGYKEKKISINKYNNVPILLSEKVEELEEVYISNKKIKYSEVKLVGLKKKLKVRTTLPFGYEFSNLIINPYKKKGVIKTVILDLNKSKKYDYLATYNIKFYNYDPIKKQPGELIYYRNIIINPKNKTYKLKIDVESLKIDFPENGVCIGVEIVNSKYDEPIKNMAIIAPKINFTHTKDFDILTWSRYRNKKWKERTRKSRVKKEYINGSINLEVRIEKK